MRILDRRLGLRPLALSATIPAPSLCWIRADGTALPSYQALADRTKAAELAADEARARADGLAEELARLHRR